MELLEAGCAASALPGHPERTCEATHSQDAGGLRDQPSIDPRQIHELARFLAHAENVILLRPPAVVETHLAVSLGLAAIDRGYGVYFTPMHRLVEDLGNAYE